MPSISDDGKLVVAAARSADNKDRWLVTLEPDSGKSKVIDALHDDAWIREVSFGSSGVEFLPDNESRLVSLGTRRVDAPVHARCEQ